jgi:ADP-ribosylation factor-like protein 2
MNEDVNSVSPTLGFIIKTIEYDGYVESPGLERKTDGWRYKLNICTQPAWSRRWMHWPGPGDVGGQKTLRTYWKNYFEKTDTLIWVVDATDRERIDDCRQELEGLLLEEVRRSSAWTYLTAADPASSDWWAQAFSSSKTKATYPVPWRKMRFAR